MRPAILLSFLLFLFHATSPGAAAKTLPLPGETFTVAGREAFVILPKGKPADHPVPWVWYAPTLPGLPGVEETWMFTRFLEAGVAIAGIDVGESYGSPDGRALYSAFYTELTGKRNFAPRAVMLGRSRGGLMTLAWAAENADKVAAFAGIYPVCNLASYPGVEKAAGAYHLTPEELTARLKEHNPPDRLSALAKAGVPFFAIHGDNDQVVPLETNSLEISRRYGALGGSMRLNVMKEQGHTMWEGFFQCAELVGFSILHARQAALPAKITLSSPQPGQVVQRYSRFKGRLPISGTLDPAGGRPETVEARLDYKGPWKRLEAAFDGPAFRALMEIPAGGWHRVEVRVSSGGGKVLAETETGPAGAGEVFIVAGQSNSANHGEEKQTPSSSMVSTFDGKRWRPAYDPQPGASGEGGSFLPLLGDDIALHFRVMPVGFISRGIGATSVREWLPAGSRFPQPPTIESRVKKLPDGGWESDGAAFATLVEAMKQAGPHGFRAVLWHQGESDANQKDPSRTLPGNLYREYLEKIIREARREAGWDVPWFVAQASYHVPGDEASPDIRAAQASLWKDGIALEGPDSDALKGPFRENGGKGVHFSGPGLRAHAARWSEKVIPWLEKELIPARDESE